MIQVEFFDIFGGEQRMVDFVWSCQYGGYKIFGICFCYDINVIGKFCVFVI